MVPNACLCTLRNWKNKILYCQGRRNLEAPPPLQLLLLITFYSQPDSLIFYKTLLWLFYYDYSNYMFTFSQCNTVLGLGILIFKITFFNASSSDPLSCRPPPPSPPLFPPFFKYFFSFFSS